MTVLWERFSAAAILLILFSAPFCGNTALFGQRDYVEFFAGSRQWLPLTQYGLMNLAAITMAAAISLMCLVCVYKKEKFERSDLVFPAFILLIIVRSTSAGRNVLVLLENFVLVLLLLWLAAKRGFRYIPAFSFLQAPAYWLFSLAYLANCILPMLLPDFGAFDSSVDYTTRYKGWYEFPSVIGFLSFCVIVWSFFRISSAHALKKCFPECAVLAVSCYFVYQSTHRTAFLALFLFGLLGAGHSVFLKKNRKGAAMFAIIALLAVTCQFVGKVGAKNNWEPAFIGNDDPGIEGPGIFNYSGRRALYFTILRMASANPIWGHGTGAISQELSENHKDLTVAFGSEPHSEILRTYYDWGLVGLFMLVAAGLLMMIRNATSEAFAVGGGLFGFMLTENAFLHPLWFYLPLFFAFFFRSMQSNRPMA